MSPISVDARASHVPATPTGLKPVRDVIPAHRYERSTARGVNLVLRDLGLYAVVVWGLTSTVTQYAQFGWMGRLRHRFEWGPLGSGGYYLREVWWNKIVRFTPPKRWRTAMRLGDCLTSVRQYNLYDFETGESLPYPQGT